jgi:hypothetical protein
MSFPISYKGRITISHINDPISCVFNNIRNGLEDNNASNIKTYEDKVTFYGDFFNVMQNWKVLSIISKGEIHVLKKGSSVDLIYKISFFHFLALSIVALPIILILFYAVSLITGDKAVLQNAIYLPVIWLIMFGSNYFITIIRFHAFIQKIIKAKPCK